MISRKKQKSIGVCWRVYIAIWNINYVEECFHSVLYEAANVKLLSGQAVVDSSDPGGKSA